MAEQAGRLVEVFQRVNPGNMLGGGASAADIDALVAAFPGLSVPAELLELLRVLNGSDGLPVLAGDGLDDLLSCEGIVTETRRRQSDPMWCPGWVVVNSAGWGITAVVATKEVRARSVVMDLSYGNQSYPVSCSSLTALVAASADAWEAGLTAVGPPRAQEDARATYRGRLQLRKLRSDEYPGSDGLTVGDLIAPMPWGWPRAWPTAETELGFEPYAGYSVHDAISGGLRPFEITATVVEVRGRWVRVADLTGTAWLRCAPRCCARPPPHRGCHQRVLGREVGAGSPPGSADTGTDLPGRSSHQSERVTDATDPHDQPHPALTPRVSRCRRGCGG